MEREGEGAVCASCVSTDAENLQSIQQTQDESPTSSFIQSIRLTQDKSPTYSFIQSIRRVLNCICDADRSVRRKALERLYKRFLQQDSLPSLSILQEAWDGVIFPVLLKSFYDHVEKCRELVINVIYFAIENLIEVEQTMLLCIPVLIERIGKLPLMEESEEIRLLLVKLVKSLVSHCSSKSFSTNVDSICQVLCVSLADHFHEIKKEVCDVIVLIAARGEKIPPQAAENLMKAMVPNLSHPHAKVRVAILKGLNAVMRFSLPSNLGVDFLVPSVQNLAFDHTERVRKFFFESVAEWIRYGLDGSPLSDGGENVLSFETRIPQFLPLLLYGIFDVSEEVGCTSLTLIENIGKLYEVSTQKFEHSEVGGCTQNKENLEFNANSSLVSDSDIFKEEYRRLLPAPFKGRPGKGCCKMVKDFFEQLIEPMRSRFQEWAETTRCSAARLLYALVIMAEQRANDYMRLLIPILCSAVGDENLCIAKLLVGSAHVLGWHTSPHGWLPLVLGQISNSAATSIQVANGLVIISSLLYGTHKQVRDKDFIKEVVQHLIEINLRFYRHGSIHHQTLKVLTNLVKVGGSACKAFLSDILYVLLQVQGLGPDSSFQQAVIEFEEVTANAVGLSCARDLYESEVDPLLKLVTAEHESWSTDSYGQALFQMLVQKLNVQAGPYMQGLLPVFKGCLHPDRDPSLRIKLLQLLDELFEISELAPCWSSLAAVVLGQIILPCGVWSVGKVGAAVRHAAMVAIGTFLRRDLCNQADVDNLLHSDQLLPIILSCIEEDYYVDIRIVTCHVLENVLRISGKSLNEAQREEVKKALQNRLDDSSDNVRLRVLPAISSFFYTIPSSYSDASVRSFVTSILLHMDDDNNQIRESVYKALQVCTSLKPAIVEELVKSNCDQHQMREYCDYLLAKAAYLQNNQEPSYC